MNKTLLVAAVVATGLASYGLQAFADTIVSVQFPQFYGTPANDLMGWGGYPYSAKTGPGMNYSAGLVPVQNWNVVNDDPSVAHTITNNSRITGNGAYVGTGILMDSTGADSAIQFSFNYTDNDHSAQNFPAVVWYNPGALADAYLATGVAFTRNSAASPVSLTVSGLDPSYAYDLIAYVGSPWWSTPATGSATLAGGGTIPIITAGDLTGWTAGQNYVEFAGLTGSSSQTLNLSGDNLGMSGFQLIAHEVPEPAALGLLAVGALALLRRR